MKKFFHLSFLLLLFCSLDLAASDRPSWVDGFFADLEKSYIEVVKYDGYDLNDTRDKAMQQVIKQRRMATGVESRVTTENGQIKVDNGHDVIVTSRVLAEYVERHQGGPYPYTVYLLVQTAKNPTYQVENVKISNGDYPFSGRVFVPGMAQIYKGQTVKGALFITGEALFIGGIVASFSTMSYFEYLHKQETRVNKYGDWANYAYYTGWAFVGAAVALYVANIIDGAVSKGEPFIEADGKKLSFMPIATPYSLGLAMNLNF